ncbi:MAG: hypothetical protein LBU80_06850 [Rikenellaceae bacterium]|nr:hypothetical protein [Rikenellaceae bacterium]
MKTFTKIAAVCAVLFTSLLLSGCPDGVTVSGTMPYKKIFEITEHSSFITSPAGDECKGLMGAVEMGIAEREKAFTKSWDVEYSGKSLDEALARADTEATADFDAAVASLKEWQKTFEEMTASKNYGPGSFTIAYVVRVSRDKVLRESEPIVFEYSYKKPDKK